MSIKVEDKCRTCLGTDGALSSIFNSKLTQYDLDQNTVIGLLTSFTKIQISADDEFSHQICIECLGEIERIYSFKLKCEQSDATLRSIKNVQKKPHIKCEYQSETDLFNDEYDEWHQEIVESDEEEQTGTFSESGMTDTDLKSCDGKIVKHEENAADEHMQSVTSEIKLEKDLQESVCPKENVKEEPTLDISTDDESEESSDPEKTPDESIDEIIECPACFEQYVGIDDLKMHIIDNHTEGKLCRLCNTEFDCESQHCWYHLRGISQHRTGKIQKPNEFQCTICLKRFATKWFLKRHVKRHTEEKSFKCEICSKMFKKKQALESHAIVHHSTQSVSDDDHQCKICSKMFGNKYHLLRHSKIHSEEKPFKCEICLKAFKQKCSLECHVIVTHSTKSNEAKNDLQCKICLKIFENEAYLLRHTQMHTEEKPYQREICLKTFDKKQAQECLNNVFHFTQPVSDELQCKICSKIFGYKSHLLRHSKVHTDETTLKCDICLKSFLRKNNLTTHMRQRHGIEMNNSRNEDVKCELCSRLVGNQLVRHLRCHTKETPFKCEVCSTAFRYKSNMKVHMRLKHASESAEL